MWRCWAVLILAWVSMATPTLGQSGDGEWGSGFGIYSVTTSPNATSQAAGDEPERARDIHTSSTTPAPPPAPPPLAPEPGPDRCSAYFSTGDAASARRLRAQTEELAYLQAIQRGNEEVTENLTRFVATELGGQSYEDAIRENVLGLQEEHKRCHEEVERAEGDLGEQLEGEGADAFSGMQKIREESQAFDAMLRAAADIARRLESSSQTLQASFTKPLKNKFRVHH